METSTQEEKQYTKCFNQGYMLAKHEPELFAQITKGNENSSYIKTMKQGAKQAEREKVREELKEIHDANSKDKDRDKEHEL